MHHRVADLDAGRPAIGEDAAALFAPAARISRRDHRLDRPRRTGASRSAGLPAPQRAARRPRPRSFARTTIEEEPNTSWPSAASAAEGLRLGREQRPARLIDALADAAARDGGDRGVRLERGDALLEGSRGCPASASSAGAELASERLGRCGDEGVEFAPFDRYDEPGIGAELPRAHRQRGDDRPRPARRRASWRRRGRG